MNNFSDDNRILKQCRTLRETGDWSVVVFAIHDDGQTNLETQKFGIIRRFSLFTRPLPKWKIMQGIKYIECWLRMFFTALRLKPYCVQANDLSALPVGWSITSTMNVPLIYDAHELETEVNGLKQGSFRQRLMVWLETNLIPKTNAILTVSESIADWYSKNYGIPKPEVVRNIPCLTENTPNAESLKKNLGIPYDSLLFLYLGHLCPGRGIPRMLETFSRVKRGRHLLFIGNGALEAMIQEFSAKHHCIHHLPAVPPDKVVPYAAGADIGMCLIENASLSDYYSLPNKLFEYILAGLPVCINDFPDQRDLVESFGCGWVLGDSITDSVLFVESLSKEAIAGKRIGVKTAQKSLSWKNEAEKYIRAINSVLPEVS